jgi:hypothetical protein
MYGRKRGEEVEGPPADGSVSYANGGEYKNSTNGCHSGKELTCRIPDVMEGLCAGEEREPE